MNEGLQEAKGRGAHFSMICLSFEQQRGRENFKVLRLTFSGVSVLEDCYMDNTS